MGIVHGDSVLDNGHNHWRCHQELMENQLALLGGASLVKLNLPVANPDSPDDSHYFAQDEIRHIRRLPGVAAAAQSVYSWWPTDLLFDAYYQRKKFGNVKVMGVDPSFFRMTAYLPIEHGRALEDNDVTELRPVCVMGKDVKEWLFGEESVPLGESIQINGWSFQIVGLLGDTDESDLNETVVLPVSTARTKLQGMNCLRRLTVLAKDVSTMAMVHARIFNYIDRRKHGQLFSVTYDTARCDKIKEILSLFELFVWIGIGIVLILSWVGVANVMFAMVRERIPEIGLRRSLGATKRAIARQFMVESVLVSATGAAVGILSGTAIGFTFTRIVSPGAFRYDLYIWSVIMACLAATASGMLFGVWPAKFAAKVDPITAIRHQ